MSENDSCPFHTLVLTLKTNGELVTGTHYATGWSAIVLLSMIFFVASYATGLGNVPWQQGELFSLEGEPQTSKPRTYGHTDDVAISTSISHGNVTLISPRNRYIPGHCRELGC